MATRSDIRGHGDTVGALEERLGAAQDGCRQVVRLCELSWRTKQQLLAETRTVCNTASGRVELSSHRGRVDQVPARQLRPRGRDQGSLGVSDRVVDGRDAIELGDDLEV